MNLREMLAPLAARDFRLLFSGSFVSYVGSAVAPVALAFAILDDLDGSGTDLGLVLAASWVPQILFVLVGGVVADRLPRHLVLVAANVISGGAQIVAAFLLLSGAAELWHLAALQVARGIATSFFFPAVVGVIPQVAPANVLQQANALLRLTNNTTFIVGTAVGGVVVATLGPGWALAFDGATYFASAVILLPIRVSGRVDAKTTFVQELREGWDEFRSREWVWAIVVAALFGNMVWMGSFAVLGPVVADNSLGGAPAWGAIMAVQSAGLLLGGVLALRLRPRRPLFVAQVAILLVALPIIALAAELPVVAIAAAAALGGAAVELFGIYWQTALQQHIPPAVISRVSSYDALGSFIVIPVGLTVAGPLSDAIGLTETLWLAAAIFLVAQGAALLSRQVRELERLDGVVAPASPTPPTEESAPPTTVPAP